MIGDLEDPEMELGLDPDLGEGGEEERILGGCGKAAEEEDGEGSKGAKQGGGAKPGTFKELHKRLIELKGAEEDAGEEGAEGSKERVRIHGLACWAVGLFSQI